MVSTKVFCVGLGGGAGLKEQIILPLGLSGDGVTSLYNFTVVLAAVLSSITRGRAVYLLTSRRPTHKHDGPGWRCGKNQTRRAPVTLS